MSDEVWSCSAIRIIGNEKYHGILTLNKDEFVFRHDLVTDILPINILTVLTSEQFINVTGYSGKQKVVVINSAQSYETSLFILEDATSDIVNQRIEQIRKIFLNHERERQRLENKEHDILAATREKARIRRKLIRDQIKQKHTEQNVSERALQTLHTENFEKDITIIQTDFQTAQSNSRSVNVQTDKPPVTLNEAPPEGSARAKTEMHECKESQDHNDYVCENHTKHELVLRLISLIDARCTKQALILLLNARYKMLALENTLIMNRVLPKDAPAVARIITDIDAHKPKQSKLYLYNKLRQQFGNTLGTQYYYDIVHLLNT